MQSHMSMEGTAGLTKSLRSQSSLDIQTMSGEVKRPSP